MSAPVLPRILNADFSLSGWFDVGEHGEDQDATLVSWFDRTQRRGLTLSLVSGGGGYSSQGDAVRLSYGIDAGSAASWEDCGFPDPKSRYVSNSLTVFDGALHAATTDSSDLSRRGGVYRYLGGRRWQSLGRPQGVDAHGIGPMVVHGASLYVAAWTYDWTLVNELPLSPVHVYRMIAPGDWEDCGQPGECRRINGLGSYAGRLYASGDDDAVHVFDGDKGWSVAVSLPTYAHPLHVSDGRLWVGTVDPGQVWSFDGATWRPEGNPRADGVEASQLHSLARQGDDLLVGSWPNGFVSRRDRVTGAWNDLGAPAEATEINALQTYNGMLYAGALPYADVARHDGGSRWTSIRRFNTPAGWRAASVAESGWRDREGMRENEGAPGDDLMREWGRVTSMVEHDGRLFISTGNCTSSYRDDAGDARLGGVYAMSAGTVATSESAIPPGRHHVVAVRSSATVRLYLDAELVAERTGEIAGDLGVDVATPRTGTGLIDECWHDHALSVAEVAELASLPQPAGSDA